MFRAVFCPSSGAWDWDFYSIWYPVVVVGRATVSGSVSCCRSPSPCCMNTDRLITRPRKDWSARLAEFKIFCRQLCTKVQMRPTKVGLGVRIYNLRKGGSYESRSSESRGPFCNWFVVHASKYFADFASAYAWSFFRLFKVPCTISQDIPMLLTAVWYITSEKVGRNLEYYTFFVSVYIRVKVLARRL